MAEEKKTALWKRIAGYSAFGIFSLILSFFLTFPYDSLKDRARVEADGAGYFLKIDSMGPGFLSVKAKGVKVSKKVTSADPNAPPAQDLVIDELSVRPKLFPPGIRVSMSAFDGSAAFSIDSFAFYKLALGIGTKSKDPLGTVSIGVHLDELDLSKGNLDGFTGIKFGGKVSGDVQLDAPLVSNGVGFEPDLGQANGNVVLDGKALAINGGTASIVIPMYGAEPTPLDLPKIVVGDLTGKLKFDKGAGTVDELKAKSADLELGVTGTMKLAKTLAYAEPNLEIRFKPDPEFQKRLGLIGSALSAVGPDPKDPSWRMGHLTGFFGRPNFR
jgi:type II secretion system protein N